jgi:hypothetical protein
MTPDFTHCAPVNRKELRRSAQHALKVFYALLVREGISPGLRDWFEHVSMAKQLPTPNPILTHRQ